MALVPRSWLRRLAARGLLPRSAFARVTAYLLALYVLLAIVRAVSNATDSARAAASVSGWVTGLGFAVAVLLVIFLVRWVRRRLLWRLRNRLIVTYVFIAVIPVALLLLMAVMAGYFLVGQFATFLATSDLRAELNQLKISNDELAAQIAAQLSSGAPPERVAQIVRGSEQIDRSTPRSVSFWLGGNGFLVRPGAEPKPEPEDVPAWLQKELGGIPEHEFRAFLVSGGKVRFYAARELHAKNAPVIVASSTPLTPAMLSRLAQ